MKVVMKLAIVLAALLVVSNMAFAQCDQHLCYEVIATDENGNTHTDTWDVCLRNSGIGWLYSFKAAMNYDLYLFGGGPSWFNTSGDPQFGGTPYFTSWIATHFNAGPSKAGYLQPSLGGLLLTGEGHDGSTRYTIKGKKVPSIPNCES